MVCINTRQGLDLRLDEYMKAEELASLLDIDVVSAQEMMNGSIPFTNEEFKRVASHLGITVEGLV